MLNSQSDIRIPISVDISVDALLEGIAQLEIEEIDEIIDRIIALRDAKMASNPHPQPTIKDTIHENRR